MMFISRSFEFSSRSAELSVILPEFKTASEKVPIYRALTTIIFVITVLAVVLMNIRAKKRPAKEGK